MLSLKGPVRFKETDDPQCDEYVRVGAMLSTLLALTGAQAVQWSLTPPFMTNRGIDLDQDHFLVRINALAALRVLF